MPYIQIKSLPFRENVNIPGVLHKIVSDFSDAMAVPAAHVTITWEYLAEGHYISEGRVSNHQMQHSHPVIIDVLAPDIESDEVIAQILETIVDCVARHVSLPRDNLFANYRYAYSGRVFEEGTLKTW